jgi:protein-tyrosine phosphatase
MAEQRIGVLFVCMGNICRSPLAECVFRHLARERGVEHLFEIDSAGISGYHAGDSPDERSVATALRRGVAVVGRSRKLGRHDLSRFDYVIVMDEDNLGGVQRLAADQPAKARVHLLREWDPKGGPGHGVPDPYYGGPRGFEDVHDIVERSCRPLLDHLLASREEE